MCSKENNRLADEITELASHIHAATCRWLGLVAEFDTRGGWGEWGCRSCSHWLSWRCSISPVAAREHVRVAHRLEELPLIRGAFAEGRLSYSQVRALTRVENVEREEELLSLARHATAAQLERLVRAYHGVVARARVAAGGGPDRYVTWDHADDGSLLLRARLPAEEGAVVLAALQAAVERGASAEALAAAPASAGPPAVEAASADGAVSAEAAAADRKSHDARSDFNSAEAPAFESAEAPSFQGASAEAPSLGERRADALVLMADTLLANEPNGRGGDRFQVVVHVDVMTLRDGDGESELADGAPIDGETARRLACDFGDRAAARARGPVAGRRAQDAQRPTGAASCACEPRPRLSLPRLREPPHGRRPPHRALGERRCDEPGEPRAALPPSPPAAARGRLHGHQGRIEVRVPPSGRPPDPSVPAEAPPLQQRAAGVELA
jgi:hypothetical protein